MPIRSGPSFEGRILLVEDGADNQRLVSILLRRAGASVDIAENGLVALALLAESEGRGRPYQILLTDIEMPEMDGLTLARNLRARGSRLPIVAVTALTEKRERARCFEAGCDDFVAKPIDQIELLTVCAHWLSRGSSRT